VRNDVITAEEIKLGLDQYSTPSSFTLPPSHKQLDKLLEIVSFIGIRNMNFK